MKLSEEQAKFTADLVALIAHANTLPECRVVLKEVYRPPETAALYEQRGMGIARSLHCSSLAADLALFVEGVYQTQTSAYRALGDWWEFQDDKNRWGGRFTRPDGNHFERRIKP